MQTQKPTQTPPARETATSIISRNQLAETDPKKALAALVARIAGAQAEINALVLTNLATPPANLHWGHVGDAGRVLDDLNAILDYLG